MQPLIHLVRDRQGRTTSTSRSRSIRRATSCRWPWACAPRTVRPRSSWRGGRRHAV